MKLLKEITEQEVHGTPKKGVVRYSLRKAARAVLSRADGKIALLHVKNSEYYKLPGGGVDEGEDFLTALKRECMEETGCTIEVKAELGQIVEFRNKIRQKQESYCYIAWVKEDTGVLSFEKDEKEEGFSLVWEDPEEALNCIEESKPTSYDGPFIVIRDALFLKTAMETTIKTISGGGVVINKEGKVVAVNQHGDSWSLPKGHIDLGEDAITAAKREILEESGISDLTLVKKLGSYERYRIARGGKKEDKGNLKKIIIYLFTTSQETLKPIDPHNPEARWVEKEKVADLLTHHKDKEFFLSIIDQL